MRKSRNVSLNVKLALAVIPLVLVFMGFNFYFILQHERQILKDETEKRARSLAAGLSILSAEAQRTFSEYQLQTNVEKFSQLQDVVKVAVAAPDGKILAHNVMQERGKTIPDIPDGGHHQVLRYVPMGNGHRVLEVFEPIMLGDRQTGIVWIVLSLAGHDAALAHSQRYLGGLTLILLGGSGIFVIFLAHWFTRPLLRLVEVATALSNGDLSVRARLNQNDEIGILGSAFNHMASRLQGMVEKEKDARSRLQTRIAKLLEFTDRVVAGDLTGHAEAGEDDEMGRLTLAVNAMVRHLRIILEDERATRENLERSRAELERANEKLKELDQLKSEFLNTVSHELRTPLTSIKAFAEILLDSVGEDPETQREFLEIINKESDRLTRLINNLLDLSRIEAGRMNWNYEAGALDKLVDAACETLRMAAGKKGVNFEVQHDGLPLPILGDHDKLIQVITNLVGNAIKFTPEGGTVTISTRLDGEVGEIVVADSGMGVAPEHHARIFEKFGQVDTSETREIKGSGLGLPIARSIVEAHQGTLTVESERGHGARFIVRLPLQGAITPSAAGIEAPPAEPTRRPVDKTVLIVDDEANIRRFLRHILELEGYDVLEAASGREALTRASRHLPGLILLDLRLPDMTGFETLSELKRQPETRNIPVVVLSIIQDPELGFRLGASDFLTKPIDRDRLVERIAKLLGGPGNRDILLVEDDESVRTAVRHILQTHGYRVRAAASAEEGLQLLSEMPSDLILLDLMLPGMSGTEFLMEIKRKVVWKDIPVVVLTAAGPEAQTQAMAAGAKHVVGKPFSEASLTELVKGVLERVASHSEGTESRPNESTPLTEDLSAQNNSSC
jgi:signal transduction histidine kinase/CheY-like chemotaxis protein